MKNGYLIQFVRIKVNVLKIIKKTIQKFNTGFSKTFYLTDLFMNRKNKVQVNVYRCFLINVWNKKWEIFNIFKQLQDKQIFG